MHRKLIIGFSLWAAMAALSSCGYHLAGKALNSGKGQTIAVPTFINRTTGYRIEQQFSEAVRQELIRRTHFSVQSADTGDLVMAGEVTGLTLSPVIFNPQGRGSTYSVIVDMKVNVTDTRTNTMVFKNDHWTFRGVFELAQSSSEYVPEDAAAMDRISRRFAASLVDSILHAKQ
jgi:outer membrane lipopolysaccharide assembly protein LptE/RlpB